MGLKPRTLVVVLLVVGQIGVVTATSDGAIDASIERNDGGEQAEDVGSPGFSAITHPRPVMDVTRPQQVGILAADLVDSARDLVPTLLIPPIGYSRHDDSDPLENEVRRTVYETVLDEPGKYVSRIAIDTDTPESTVRYHVRILEDETLVETRKIRGKRRVFPANAADASVEIAMHDEVTADVLETIERTEPASVSTLADALDRSPSTVSYHVSRLEESGLITRDRDGSHVLVSLTRPTRTRLNGDAGTG